METLYKNYTIKIKHDDNPESPRDWDNLARMICFHRNYALGDEHNYTNMNHAFISLIRRHATHSEKLKLIKEKIKHSKKSCPTLREFLRVYGRDLNLIIEDLGNFEKFSASDLPDSIVWENLYLYDHSGITMNTTGFSCGWDSGCVGFIYTTKEKLNSEEIRDCLIAEVKTYDQYLRGDIYGYIIEDKEGEQIDSCWGFYGYDETLEEAKTIVDHLINTTPQQLELLVS